MIVKHSKEIVIKPEVVKKRSYKHFSADNFLREIKYTDFSPVLQTVDASTSAMKFSEIFTKVLDNHAPVKNFQTRKHYLPWLSEEIKELKEERNKLKEESKISIDPNKLKKYKKLRNEIKPRLKTKEPTYYENKFVESNSDIKKTWSLIYEFP